MRSVRDFFSFHVYPLSHDEGYCDPISRSKGFLNQFLDDEFATPCKAWNQWEVRTDLTGALSLHENYAYMAELAKVSKLSMADKTKKSVTIQNSRRNFASTIDSSLSYIVTYDTEFSIHILEGYADDSVNKTVTLAELCPSIDLPQDAQDWLAQFQTAVTSNEGTPQF